MSREIKQRAINKAVDELGVLHDLNDDERAMALRILSDLMDSILSFEAECGKKLVSDLDFAKATKASLAVLASLIEIITQRD